MAKWQKRKHLSLTTCTLKKELLKKTTKTPSANFVILVLKAARVGVTSNLVTHPKVSLGVIAFFALVHKICFLIVAKTSNQVQ